MRALIEEGLRHILSVEDRRTRHRLADRSVGNPTAEDPLAALGPEELRDLMYGDS